MPRGLTWPAGDVAPAIAKGCPGHRGLVVAFLVPVALLIQVEALAVQFDDQPAVLRIGAVTVTIRPVAFPEPGLLDRLRKAVGALYIPVVPVLKGRVHPARGQRNDFV